MSENSEALKDVRNIAKEAIEVDVIDVRITWVANYDENVVIDTIMTINNSPDFINENFGLNRYEIVSPKRFSLVYRHLISKL